jgi:hypothetical protein
MQVEDTKPNWYTDLGTKQARHADTDTFRDRTPRDQPARITVVQRVVTRVTVWFSGQFL